MEPTVLIPIATLSNYSYTEGSHLLAQSLSMKLFYLLKLMICNITANTGLTEKEKRHRYLKTLNMEVVNVAVE